ncbi:hypothetical protein M5G22_09265 [Pseudomonas sp. TNT2022 ID233]|uniref:hypothetical protein n=1 Tax=Pseudomonas aphyarum TaxID=2942629 RepID=UPI00235EBE63|nr:hypothetical protein [Pseudomonas aphyarum]MDD1137737.1 hypothetical protein [Pseudomonas aphyarum]
MTLEARPHASVEVAKNCEDSDMAHLTKDTRGSTDLPWTPGSHADNLVLQILETR